MGGGLEICPKNFRIHTSTLKDMCYLNVRQIVFRANKVQSRARRARVYFVRKEHYLPDV